LSGTTRDRILDAAAHVMRTQGFARATTKEIARAAGFSEGTLYKHFADKFELFLAVLHERVPGFGPFARALHEQEGPLRDRLIAVARAAIEFYTEGFPMSASVFSEPELLAAHRAAMARLDAGPHRPIAALAAFFRAEQHRGHIRAGADCAAAAALLLGASFQYAFLCAFAQNRPEPAEVEAYAESVIDTLLAGLSG
jgi:AcrR family transcriptional regulator